MQESLVLNRNMCRSIRKLNLCSQVDTIHPFTYVFNSDMHTLFLLHPSPTHSPFYSPYIRIRISSTNTDWHVHTLTQTQYCTWSQECTMSERCSWVWISYALPLHKLSSDGGTHRALQPMYVTYHNSVQVLHCSNTLCEYAILQEWRDDRYGADGTIYIFMYIHVCIYTYVCVCECVCV